MPLHNTITHEPQIRSPEIPDPGNVYGSLLLMANTTVVVLGHLPGPMLKKLESLGPGIVLKSGKTARSLQPEVADARVLFNWGGARDELKKVMTLAPGLEWIHARFAGLDHMLFPELVESPIVITNGSGIFSPALGEFVILGVLFFAKDVTRLLNAKAERRWDLFDMDEISRQTLGIVGHGDIGRAIAWRAKGLGMRVLALRRDPSPRAGDEHVDRVYSNKDILTMLPECDYVAVAAPLTPETKGMFSKAEFGAMKPEAIIMNVGRGPVIDEPAMIEALRSKQIRGAALDVFAVEPLPPESPLWSMGNVLISAHTADHTKTWVAESVDFFIEQFDCWRAGKPLKNVVDKHAGY